MPRLPQVLLESTFYLFENVDDARSGDGYGGTGFLIGKQLEADHRYCSIYAVSNAHVAAMSHPVLRLNKSGGGTHIIDLIADQWVFDPMGYDIAITPMMRLPDDVPSKYVDAEMFATDGIIEEKGISPEKMFSWWVGFSTRMALR